MVQFTYSTVNEWKATGKTASWTHAATQGLLLTAPLIEFTPTILADSKDGQSTSTTLRTTWFGGVRVRGVTTKEDIDGSVSVTGNSWYI